MSLLWMTIVGGCAIAIAVSRLPTPAGPAMSTAGGIESRAMTRASSDNRRE